MERKEMFERTIKRREDLISEKIYQNSKIGEELRRKIKNYFQLITENDLINYPDW